MLSVVTQRPSRSSHAVGVDAPMASDPIRDPRGARELVPLLYEELRALARHYLTAERCGHSLEPSDLVHEALRRLLGQTTSPQGRSQFMALAATAMRRALVDHARERLAQKRGGGAERVPLSQVEPFSVEEPSHVLALDEALASLGARNARLARVVELHFLGGLTLAETAECLGVSVERVRLDWRFARAWVNRELLGG